MSPMNPALFGSTGAADTSTFHQLSGGKSGSGAGRGAGGCGAWATAAPPSTAHKTSDSEVVRIEPLRLVPRHASVPRGIPFPR